MSEAKRGGIAPVNAASASWKGRAKNRGVAILFVGALAYAPYQCGKAPDPSVREETPGEALYGLALKMKADGDEQGYRTTLRYILARYPSSRYAAAARVDLSADAADTDGP